MKSRTWSLKYFLSFQFLLVSLIPIIIVVVLAGIFLFPHLSRQEAQEQEALAGVITSRVSGQIEAGKRELRHLAALLYTLDLNVDTQPLLDNVAEINPFYEAIYITDLKGLVIQVGLPDKTRPLRNNFIDLDMSRKPFFVEYLKTQQENWSNTFLSAVSGRLSVAYIVSTGRHILIAEVSIDTLPELSGFLSKDSGQTIMILDRKGQLLAHPDASLNGQQLNFSRLSLVQEGLKLGKASQAFDLSGKQYFGSLVTAENIGWMVVVYQTLENHQSTLLTSGLILLTALLAGILIALIVARVIGGVSSRRFQAYTRLAEAMTTGHYDVKPAHSAITEVDALGRDIWNAGQQINSREQALKTKEQRYRALVEQSPVAVIEWDENLKVIAWNKVAENILGFLEKDSFGSVLGFMAQEENQQQLSALAARFEIEESFVDENYFQTEQGDRVTCRSFNAVIRDDEGQLLGYLSLIEDITEQNRIEQEIKTLNSELEQRVNDRTNALSNTNDHLKTALKNLKRTQTELVRADKLAALGGMVAGVSHELNTPIGNALMAITTLQQQTRQFSDEYHSVGVKRSSFESYLNHCQESEQLVAKNLNRAAELVTSFKQVAVDQTSSQMRQFELKQQVDEVLLTLKPVMNKSTATLKSSIPEGLLLNSYPGPLGQVITNLITNALIHGLEGKPDGVISISAEEVDKRSVQIIVEDNGWGIPAENLDKVFEPFFSTRLGDGGTGLGLHIVHNIVTEALKGSIELGSNEEGTRFVVTIPLFV